MHQSPVSVIVVSYNTAEKLRRCLSQIEPDHEVIVVDNASEDGSPDLVRGEFPHVLLIENETNLGFGPANNIGAGKSSRPYLLFLNSDAYAEPGAIDLLAARFADQEVVGVGGMLLNPDGSLQESTANRLTLWAVFCEQFYLEKLAPNSALFSPYWNTRRLVTEAEPAETSQVMGACLMIRSGSELFDERFFLYCEDTDLCDRLRRHGQILYVKSARFVHELGSSSSKSPVKGVYRYNRGKELYFRLHQGALASFLCAVMNRSGAFVRSLYWLLKSIRGGMEARLKTIGFFRVALGLEP